jgi:hypothetical protein
MLSNSARICCLKGSGDGLLRVHGDGVKYNFAPQHAYRGHHRRFAELDCSRIVERVPAGMRRAQIEEPMSDTLHSGSIAKRSAETVSTDGDSIRPIGSIESHELRFTPYSKKPRFQGL